MVRVFIIERISNDCQEKFEDTKGVIRIRKVIKWRQFNVQKKTLTIYKTLHRKPKIEHHEPLLKTFSELG